MAGERRPGGRQRVEEVHQVSAGQLHRLGLLAEGAGRWLQLEAQGPRPAAAVLVEPFPQGVYLNMRQAGGAWSGFAPMEWLPCCLGGRRPWFRCPASGCRRRCAALFLGREQYGCRRCLRLAYRSEQVSAGRQRRRAQIALPNASSA